MNRVDTAGRSSSDALTLTVISPAGESEEVRVTRSPFRIGRQPDRDLTLKDARISREHAVILLEDGAYYIEDSQEPPRPTSTAARCNERGCTRTTASASARGLLRDSRRRRRRPKTGPLLERVAQLPGGSEGTGNLHRLSAVLDVARALESAGSVDEVLAAAVDSALALTGAERGFLLLKGATDELEIRIARDSDGKPLPPDDLRVPRKVIAEALRKRSDLFAMSFDSAAGQSADAGQTVLALELRSVVCVPLVKIRLGGASETRMLSTAMDTIGALYMDSRKIGSNLAEGNKDLLETLGIEISTVLENARLLDEERKKHHLEQELQIAREIQQGLLPARLPEQGWLVAAGSSEACFQVGGDYFDVVEISPTRWGAVLADVSGKGVSAALLNSLLQGAFFAAAASQTQLSESVGRINNYVCERSRNARFATVFCCVVERDGKLEWLNAGHCDGAARTGRRSRSRSSSRVHARSACSRTPSFPSQAVQLSARRPAGRSIPTASPRRPTSPASATATTGWPSSRRQPRGLTPTELHRKLIEEIGAFTQGAEQNDDLTLLVLGYEG